MLQLHFYRGNLDHQQRMETTWGKPGKTIQHIQNHFQVVLQFEQYSVVCSALIFLWSSNSLLVFNALFADSSMIFGALWSPLVPPDSGLISRSLVLASFELWSVSSCALGMVGLTSFSELALTPRVSLPSSSSIVQMWSYIEPCVCLSQSLLDASCLHLNLNQNKIDCVFSRIIARKTHSPCLS